MQVGQRASCHMAKEVQQHLRISNLLEWNDVLRSRWGMGAGWVSVDRNIRRDTGSAGFNRA